MNTSNSEVVEFLSSVSPSFNLTSRTTFIYSLKEPTEAKCRVIGPEECLWLSVQILNTNTATGSQFKLNQFAESNSLEILDPQVKPVVKLGVAFENNTSFLVALAIAPSAPSDSQCTRIGNCRLQMAARGQFLLGDRISTPLGSFFDVPVGVKPESGGKPTVGEALEATAGGIAEATGSTAQRESPEQHVYTMEIDKRSLSINFYVDGEFLIATPSIEDIWVSDFPRLQPRVRIDQVGYRVDIVSTPKYKNI